MKIGEAIEAMRQGKTASRPTWRPGERVWFVPGDQYTRDHLAILDDEGMQFPWTPLSRDLLADDWETN